MSAVKTMILAMAKMQDAYNQQVHPQWDQQNYEYYRAIWVECAELLDHFGWKWWKHQVPDYEQSKLEIIDIWHFGLSDLIRAGKISTEHIDKQVFAIIEKGIEIETGDLREAVEAHALATLGSRAFDIPTFFSMMRALPLSFDDLYSGYIGKNVLNTFRQDNGYKDGSYIKNWGGVEDNEHLVEISSGLNLHTENYAGLLYSALKKRYLELQ